MRKKKIIKILFVTLLCVNFVGNIKAQTTIYLNFVERYIMKKDKLEKVSESFENSSFVINANRTMITHITHSEKSTYNVYETTYDKNWDIISFFAKNDVGNLYIFLIQENSLLKVLYFDESNVLCMLLYRKK